MEAKLVTIPSLDGHIVNGTLNVPEDPVASALLVHGITADRHEWGFFDSLVTNFGKKNVTTLAIDYRGHGDSQLSIDKMSLSGVMLDVISSWKFLRAFDPNKPSFLVGNSFGGGIAYLFGQGATDCAHIYMTCPVTSYVADVSRVNANWQDDAKSGLVNYASKQLNSFIIPEFYVFDRLVKYQKVNVPFSVVHGSEDSDVPPEESKAFLMGRAPDSNYHALAGMDHSFSAPESAPNRNVLSPKLRQEAAEYIASILEW